MNNYSNKSNDYSGNHVFVVRLTDNTVRFFPQAMDTIHEYIKAKQEIDEEKQQPKCGAV